MSWVLLNRIQAEELTKKARRKAEVLLNIESRAEEIMKLYDHGLISNNNSDLEFK